MRTKVCFKCKEEKSIDSFYKHPQMADGHLNKCKECNKADVKENRKRKEEKYRKYERKRASDPKRIDARRMYAKSDRGKEAHKRSAEKWQVKNAYKRVAHCVINNAVRDGKLIKPDSCCICGAYGKIIGHHNDYEKPLDVVWLCPKHHAWIHRMLKRS